MTLPQQVNGKGPVAPPKKLPDIVIVGGGAGGLELATHLGHRVGRKQANTATSPPPNRGFRVVVPAPIVE